MRRQRVLRTSSAKSLCIFCACRLGVDVPPSQLAPFVSKRFSTIRAPQQSAAAAAAVAATPTAPNSDSTSNSNDPPGFAFDPTSSLSQTEQREKAQRQAVWRQEQAREQELKQQQIWEETQVKSQQTVARRAEGRQRHPLVQGSTNVFWRSGVNSASQPLKPSSIQEQGSTLSRSLFDAPKAAHNAGSKEHSVFIRKHNHNSGKVRKNGASTQKHDVETQSPKQFGPPISNLYQQKRMPLPDFLKDNKTNSGDTAKRASGWGVGATVMKAVEYGDTAQVRPLASADGSATLNPLIQDSSRGLKQRPQTIDPQSEPKQSLHLQYEDSLEQSQRWNKPLDGAPTPQRLDRPDGDRVTHHQYDGPHSRVNHNKTNSPAANIGTFGYHQDEHNEESLNDSASEARGTFSLPGFAGGNSNAAESSSHNRPKEPYPTGQDSRTGYHSLPIDPEELRPIQDIEEDQSAHWQHLRRKEPEPQAPQPAESSQQRSSYDDNPAWVDQMFRAHQEQRPKPMAPMQTAIGSYSLQLPDRTRNHAVRTCGRCGEKGHAAHECTGPKRANNELSRRRRQTPRSVYDDPYALESLDQASQQRRESFAGSSLGPRQAAPQRTFRHSQYDDPFTASFDELSREQRQHHYQRRRQEDDVFSNSNTRSQVRFEGRSRLSSPFFTTEDSSTSANESRSRNGEHQRFITRKHGSPDDLDNSSSKLFAVRSQLSSSSPAEEDASFRKGQRPKRSAEAEEGQQGPRSSRKAQWEDLDEELESRNKLFDRRKGQRNSRREIDDEDDEHEGARDAYRARKAARQAAKDSEKEAKNKAQRRQREARKAEQAAPITLPEFISVQRLSQMLGVRYEQFVERLEDLGYDDVFPGKTLNAETSGMIAMEYNFEPLFDTGAREEEERDLKSRPEVGDKELLPIRPPVVTIMGHVDHGKTTILDYLRKSSVATGEAGGITQHIGAFSVPLASSGKTITFLDTPGHAAFLAMRQRGANVTDIVVLVVAADDSVKPQTLEALKHAKAAGVPIIVAINKVDKEEADIQRCKQDLARHGIEIEDFGGDTQVVCVSGKTGRGMDELEESVVTLSEILDHRADSDGSVEGWILEATTKKAGRVATVLVRRGTLKPGCVIVAGKTWARVRTLKNEGGKSVREVGPGMPVEVDGWKDQPMAGDEVLQAPSEQKATSVVEYRLELEEREKTAQDMEAINEARRVEQEKREKEKAAEHAAKRAAASGGGDVAAAIPVTVESSTEQQSGQMTVPFIIKADVSGSAEAVSAYILSISNPLIAPQILQSSVGAIHESDIDLASAASGHILAFNLSRDEEMKGAAEARGVKVLENDVIYRLLDDVKALLEEKLPPVITQRVLGEAEVGAAFEIGIGGRKKVKVAGCKVRNGYVNKGGRVRVMRGGDKVYDGTINSLKNVKKDVQEMRKGSECGMGFDNWEDFEVGDQIQTYEEISEQRKL